jgi:hypothetical protein
VPQWSQRHVHGRTKKNDGLILPVVSRRNFSPCDHTSTVVGRPSSSDHAAAYYYLLLLPLIRKLNSGRGRGFCYCARDKPVKNDCSGTVNTKKKRDRLVSTLRRNFLPFYRPSRARGSNSMHACQGSCSGSVVPTNILRTFIAGSAINARAPSQCLRRLIPSLLALRTPTCRHFNVLLLR